MEKCSYSDDSTYIVGMSTSPNYMIQIVYAANGTIARSIYDYNGGTGIASTRTAVAVFMDGIQ